MRQTTRLDSEPVVGWCLLVTIAAAFSKLNLWWMLLSLPVSRDCRCWLIMVANVYAFLFIRRTLLLIKKGSHVDVTTLQQLPSPSQKTTSTLTLTPTTVSRA